MKSCPYCAEEIQDAAIKCKHCGEFLETPKRGAPPQTGAQWELYKGEWVCRLHSDPHCSLCAGRPAPVSREPAKPQPIWRFGGLTWRCIAHEKFACASCSQRARPPSKAGKKGDVFPDPNYDASRDYTGRIGEREQLSHVGAHTEGGALSCPKCGGTQFCQHRANLDPLSPAEG